MKLEVKYSSKMSSPSHGVRTIMGCEDLSGLRSRRDDTFLKGD